MNKQIEQLKVQHVAEIHSWKDQIHQLTRKNGILEIEVIKQAT